jgi:hypothetical protein
MASRHKAKPILQARYDQGNAVIYDEKTGKFVAQQPNDYRVFDPYTKDAIGLTPEQKEKALRGTYLTNQKYAEQLNQKFGAGYGNLSAEDAYTFDLNIDKFKPRRQPQTDEEWETEYRNFLNKAGGTYDESTMSFAEFKQRNPEDSFQWAVAGKSPWGDNKRLNIYDPLTFMDDPTSVKLAGAATRTGRVEDWRPWGLNKEPYTGSMDADDGGWADDVYKRKKKFLSTYKDKDRSTISADTAKYLDELQADRAFMRRYSAERPAGGSDSDRLVDAQADWSDVMTGTRKRSAPRQELTEYRGLPEHEEIAALLAQRSPGLLDALTRRMPEDNSMTT